MRRDPSIALLLAWLVPGAGHLWLGKPRKALFLFASVCALYLAGYLLADFRFVRWDDNPFYYLGRWGSGLTWLATWLVRDNPPRGAVPLEYYETGLLYMCSAGLLNAVLVLNLLASRPSAEDKPVEASADAAPPPPTGA
jgi:hypothetical protein